MAAAAPKAERMVSVKHNRTVLYHEGYSYHYNQRSAKAKTSYYRCKLRECPGTGKIVDGNEFQTMRTHHSSYRKCHPKVAMTKKCFAGEGQLQENGNRNMCGLTK
jgi:hypothetical protein